MFQQRPRNGGSLFLTAGEGHAALADHRFITRLETLDRLMQAGFLRGLLNFGLTDVFAGDRDVLRHRSGKQERLLQHDAHAAAQFALLHIPHVHAADGDGSLAGIVEPREQQRNGALAAARFAEHAERRAALDGEAHVAEHLLLLIGKADMFKADVAGKIRRQRLGRALLLFSAQDIQQAVDGNARLAHLRQRASQRADGPRELARVADESEIRAQRDFAFHAQMHADSDHAEDLRHAHHVAQRPEHGHHIAELHPDIGVVIVLLAEFLQLIAFAAKRAHHTHAGDVFLHVAGKLALGLVRLLIALGDALIKHQRIADNHGDEREHEQRDFDVHCEHRSHIDNNKERRAEQLDHLFRDKIAHNLHVGGAALDDIARRVLHMPAVRQALDMAVERVA